MKLVSVSETRDKIRNAVRSAVVEVEVNGARATLTCGNYRLPIAIGGDAGGLRRRQSLLR